MRSYLTGHPIATVLFAATIGFWILLEARQNLKRRPEASTRDRGSRLVVGLTLVMAFLLAFLARSRLTAAEFPSNAFTFGIGLAFMWAGIALRLYAFHTLGRYFTITVMTSTDQPVITTGPYRVLRHPSYAGLLLIFTGLGILQGNWLALAAIILLPLIGLIYRIRVEEAALSTTLGDAYTSYAATRRRLVPFVW